MKWMNMPKRKSTKRLWRASIDIDPTDSGAIADFSVPAAAEALTEVIIRPAAAATANFRNGFIL